jgi:hypothetical protein
MRTLAFALAAALPVWLTAPAAHAVCTSGVDCIRERFGSDTMLRQNRLLDRTDRIGTRQPVNPYAARQSRRAAGLNRADDAAEEGVYGDEALRSPSEIRPDVRYTPEEVLRMPGIEAPGEPPAEAGGMSGPTVGPVLPAEPTPTSPSARAGAATAASDAARSRDPYAALRRAPASRGRVDPNRPAGAADLFHSGPSTGARR